MTISVGGLLEIKANPASVADGASIVSYTADAAGTLITSTLVSGKQSMDVNVTQSALPAGAATEATLAAILADFAAISSTFGAAYASGNAMAKSGVAVRNDAGGPLVAATGEYSPLSLDATGALRISGTVLATDSVNTVLQQALPVGITAVLLPTVALAGRTSLMIQNTGTKTVFIGSTTVTSTGATKGIFLEKGGFLSIDASATCAVYAVATAVGGEVTILEAAP